MDGNVRGILKLLGPVLFVSLLEPAAVQAVQTGASLSLFPTNWGELRSGDLIDVVVAINNTSTDTPATAEPGDGVDPVPAKLSGAVTLTLGCTDVLCSTVQPGALVFVPEGAGGCVDRHPGVTSCAAAGSNEVILSIGGAGIDLPPGGSVDLATIRLRVQDASSSRLGVMGLTDPGAVAACSSNAPDVCAQCDASGCTLLVFGPPAIIPCPHTCAERIVFRGDLTTPDFFEFHGLIRPAGAIDPPSQSFTLALSDAGGPILDPPLTLPPGSFVRQGEGTWRFDTDQRVRDVGGIAFVRISERDGMPGVYKIDIQAFDARLESSATDPTITVAFDIGSEHFETTNEWLSKPNGWFLVLPR